MATTSSSTLELCKKESAFASMLEAYRIMPKSLMDDALKFLELARPIILDLCQQALEKYSSLRYWSSLELKLVREESTFLTHFCHKAISITNADLIGELIDSTISKILENFDNFQQRGSGWILSSVEHLDIHIGPYRPLQAASFSPLPAKIRNKNAILNIKNYDNQCFKWCILAHLYPVNRNNNPNNIRHYKKILHKLNFDNISFPVKLTDIKRFEQLNAMTINVYGFQETIQPLYISNYNNEPRINLFYYNNHYSLIRDFQRLMYSQREHKGALHFCDRCLFPFYNVERLAQHQQYCYPNSSPQAITMPQGDEAVLKFKNINRTHRIPFMLYADFECITEKLQTCEPSKEKSFSIKYQKHTPCGFGIVGIENCCGDAKIRKPTIYSGKNSVELFL